MKAEGHYSAAYLLVALRGYLLSSFASLDELQCIERAVRPSLPEDGYVSWRPKSDARFNARSSTLLRRAANCSLAICPVASFDARAEQELGRTQSVAATDRSALCIGRHGSLPDYSSPQSLQGRGDGKPNCRTRLVKTWPTEEAAISHPKALREMVERANRHSHPSEKDWRG